VISVQFPALHQLHLHAAAHDQHIPLAIGRTTSSSEPLCTSNVSSSGATVEDILHQQPLVPPWLVVVQQLPSSNSISRSCNSSSVTQLLLTPVVEAPPSSSVIFSVPWASSRRRFALSAFSAFHPLCTGSSNGESFSSAATLSSALQKQHCEQLATEDLIK